MKGQAPTLEDFSEIQPRTNSRTSSSYEQAPRGTGTHQNVRMGYHWVRFYLSESYRPAMSIIILTTSKTRDLTHEMQNIAYESTRYKFEIYTRV